jgi:hypothetical protein
LIIRNEDRLVLENGDIRLTVAAVKENGRRTYHIGTIEHRLDDVWDIVAYGKKGQEFSASWGCCDAGQIDVTGKDDGSCVLILKGSEKTWDVRETIAVMPERSEIRITQEYIFPEDMDGYIDPGLYIRDDGNVRYTYPIRIYERPLDRLRSLRGDSSWAVTVPFHIWHTDKRVVIYGIDRTRSGGTPDLRIDENDDSVRLGIYYPDTADQSMWIAFNEKDCVPQSKRFHREERVKIEGVLSVKKLNKDSIPLLEAEKMAAGILMSDRKVYNDLEATADKLAYFYKNCGLWEPDALGKGRGWFRNMWVRVAGDTPQKDTHYDLGWGEGYGSVAICAMARNWKRTGDDDLRRFIDEMSGYIELFRKNSDPGELFYERYNSTGPLWGTADYGYTDFMGSRKIWSHSLGHAGYQLLKLYEDIPCYPDPAVRELWLKTAVSIGGIFGKRQKPDGDLQDGFDIINKECSRKAHRIPARASVCGLWAAMSRITGDKAYLQKALLLARAVSPEINACEFYNQMLDGHLDGLAGSDDFEISDGENACYALEGLVELYRGSHDREVLELCRRTAAYLISWIYFYDLPTGYHGATRGCTVCRMPDYPLLYIGAGATALIPLLRLSAADRDPFFKKMAEEILACMTLYQWDSPGKPWDGGAVHAYDQNHGLFWGPDRQGQVDSGMTSGMCLADLEILLDPASLNI